MKRAVGIIPARFGSSRLPGKPLVQILGKPLIYWVWNQVRKARTLDRILVATDDFRIKKAVEEFGGEAVMTSARFASGTDRVAAVAKRLPYHIVVNIQGDEPLIEPAAIDRLVKTLRKEKNFGMATLVTPSKHKSELFDSHLAKVVFDRTNTALYFSRHPIPFSRNGSGNFNPRNLSTYWIHIGIYAFRKDFLLKFVSWKPSRLERLEKLEQLRVLENGFPIKVVKTLSGSVPVDTLEDVKKVERILKQRI